ncbi:MAG: tetratricopeptide repeat protein, partial [Wenzhouxiangella sp.]|nr:tetratricopeptide repeat protein [Wenzhouxiangella sp.]
TRTDLAVAQIHAGQPESALETSSSTLAWLQEAFGPAHPILVLGQMRHVANLRRAGRREEASADASAVQARIVELYGERSATAGRAHVLLATLAVHQRDRELAIAHYQEARDIWLQTLGPDHPNHLRLGLNLASMLLNEDGAAEQAEALLRETHARAIRQLGSDSSTVHLSRALLAQLVGRERDGAEAMTILLGGDDVSIETLWGNPRWRQTFETLHAALGCPSSQLSADVLERCRARAANMQDA